MQTPSQGSERSDSRLTNLTVMFEVIGPEHLLRANQVVLIELVSEPH